MSTSQDYSPCQKVCTDPCSLSEEVTLRRLPVHRRRLEPLLAGCPSTGARSKTACVQLSIMECGLPVHTRHSMLVVCPQYCVTCSCTLPPDVHIRGRLSKGLLRPKICKKLRLLQSDRRIQRTCREWGWLRVSACRHKSGPSRRLKGRMGGPHNRKPDTICRICQTPVELPLLFTSILQLSRRVDEELVDVTEVVFRRGLEHTLYATERPLSAPQTRAVVFRINIMHRTDDIVKRRQASDASAMPGVVRNSHWNPLAGP